MKACSETCPSKIELQRAMRLLRQAGRNEQRPELGHLLLIYMDALDKQAIRLTLAEAALSELLRKRPADEALRRWREAQTDHIRHTRRIEL